MDGKDQGVGEMAGVAVGTYHLGVRGEIPPNLGHGQEMRVTGRVRGREDDAEVLGVPRLPGATQALRASGMRHRVLLRMVLRLWQQHSQRKGDLFAASLAFERFRLIQRV